MTDRAALAARFRHAASVWKGTCLAKVDVSAEVCDLDVIADALEGETHVSTPAQDATALADELEFHSRMQCIPEGTSAIMISAAKALRATSQTPDAVAWRWRSIFNENSWCFSTEKPLITNDQYIIRPLYDAAGLGLSGKPHDVADPPESIADTSSDTCVGGAKLSWDECPKCGATMDEECRVALSTPSASAGPQAETVNEPVAWQYRERGSFWRHCDVVTNDPAIEFRPLYDHPQPTHSQLDAIEDEIEKWSKDTRSNYPATEVAESFVRILEAAQPQQADGRGAVIEDIAKAIEGAEVEYHLRLTSLVDGVSTYALDYGDGTPTLEFDCIDDGYAHIAQKKRLKAALAVLAALSQAPATDGPAK